MSISSNVFHFFIALMLIEKYQKCFFRGQVCLTNTPNLCQQLQKSGCQGLRTKFSNTLLGLKLALMVSCLQPQNSGSQGLGTAFSFYADQNTQNSSLQLQNSGCQGQETAFFNTLLSLKLALKVVSKRTHNRFS